MTQQDTDTETVEFNGKEISVSVIEDAELFVVADNTGRVRRLTLDRYDARDAEPHCGIIREFDSVSAILAEYDGTAFADELESAVEGTRLLDSDSPVTT